MTTLKELMSPKVWNHTLKLLKQNAASIIVAAGTVENEKGSNVILDQNGFRLSMGTVTPSTAFVDESRAWVNKQLNTPAEVLRKIRECEPNILTEIDLMSGIEKRIAEMERPVNK